MPIKFRTQNPNTISTPIFAICFYQNTFHQFSFLAAIHLFASSKTKSKISLSCVEKPVAATYGVCNIIQFIIKKEPILSVLSYTTICEDILMTCAVNLIFDCAVVLICTPSNQIIEVCKQIAKWRANYCKLDSKYLSFPMVFFPYSIAPTGHFEMQAQQCVHSPFQTG